MVGVSGDAALPPHRYGNHASDHGPLDHIGMVFGLALVAADGAAAAGDPGGGALHHPPAVQTWKPTWSASLGTISTVRPSASVAQSTSWSAYPASAQT